MQDAVRTDHPSGELSVLMSFVLFCSVHPCRDNLEFLQWIKRFWDSNFGGDGYDAVIDRGEANSPQLEARDEELQDLVDKVQQLLITTSPDSEAIRRDSDDGLAESL